MKRHDDYLASSIWYREVINSPYQVIAEFFDAADIVSHRKSIEDALNAACSDDIWSKTNPGDLLFHFKLIESIINAAYLINKGKMKSPLSIGKENAFNPNLYCGWHAGLTAWDFFPRMLSFEEYRNPYLVFRRFFKYLPLPEWKRELDDIVEFALVKTSLSEIGIDIDTLRIYFHLTKLIEAAHLMDVRKVSHIGGTIKNRAPFRKS